MNPLRALRNIAYVHTWISAGMPVPPPPAVKRRLLLAMLKRYSLGVFIETGTFKGDTLADMARHVARAVSVELSDEFFAQAQQRFAGAENIELHHGDSGEVLPALVAMLEKPALFWLDGHYSAGQTAHGALASPISAELASILASPVKGHVILIDDVHEFTGQGGYPPLGQFLAELADNPDYKASVQANIIVLEPR